VAAADPDQAAAFSGPEQDVADHDQVVADLDQAVADPVQDVGDPDQVDADLDQIGAFSDQEQAATISEHEEAMAATDPGPILHEDEMWNSLEDIMEDSRVIEIGKNKYKYEACMQNKRLGLTKRVEAMENIAYLGNAMVDMMEMSLDQDNLITCCFPTIEALIEEAKLKVPIPRLRKLGAPISSTTPIALAPALARPSKRLASAQALAPARPPKRLAPFMLKLLLLSIRALTMCPRLLLRVSLKIKSIRAKMRGN